MLFDSAAYLHRGVIWVSPAIVGKGDVGHRLSGGCFLEQEREDWVIKRRRRELDLPPRSELLVQGNNPANELTLLGQEPLLLVLGIMTSPGLEVRQFAVLLEQQRVDPRQVRPYLKVAKIARAKPRQGVASRAGPRRPQVVKFVVARVWPDHRIGIRHEEIVEQIE